MTQVIYFQYSQNNKYPHWLQNGYLLFGARCYTALELFNVVTDNVEKFIEWNNIMAEFIKVDRKKADLVVRF